MLSGLAVGHRVGAAAYLIACPAVGTGIHLVEAHVAFAAHRHAEGTVAEHLKAYGLACRAGESGFGDLSVNRGHFFHVELAGEHHHVGELSVELYCLEVGDVDLCRYVHFLSDLAGVEYRGHVGGNDGRYARFFGAVYDASHQIHVGIVDHSVDGQICLDAPVGAERGDLRHVVGGEVGT